MDEVDIENVEDLNELESRLYAQIHHEATYDATNDQLPQCSGMKDMETSNSNAGGGNGNNEKNYETSSTTNRILARRYWASGEHAVKQLQQQQSSANNSKRFIRNPFKAPNPRMEIEDVPPTAVSSKNTQNKNSENADTAQNNNNNESTADKTTKTITSIKDNTALQENIPLEAAPASAPASAPTSTIPPPLVIKTKKNKNNSSKVDQINMQQKQTTASATSEQSNLKLNPIADWMKRKQHQQINKKSNNKQNPNPMTLQSNANKPQQQGGPFTKQQQKLDKAKRVEDKKQKSKKAKFTAATMAKKIKPTEIIDLDTDNESDSSDVVMIPIPPPPTFNVDDSDEDQKDEEDSKESIILEPEEENAIDSTDVQMSSTSSSFIKPHQISQHSTATMTAATDKNLENSSRCTSPCSIQSSDDFIGQIDRSRLLTGASGMADDEDLLLLTTDINSLLETPQTSSSKQHNHDEEVAMEHIDSGVEHVENLDDSLEFATPKTATRKKDYRVEQSQFRALDVYESESDITDSVYSKGAANKTTVIRQIDTSSDDAVEDISTCTQRTKRLRKRRASSSNKESESGNNDNLVSSSDNEDQDENDDNDVLRTAIPFISRGPAVERSKPRKRTRTLSSCSPITQQTRKTKSDRPSQMSDGEFIATLNNLAQGQEDEDDEADDSETENVPSARDIAEKILSKHADKTTNVETADNSDTAIPDAIYNELDKVFETIDHMDERERQINSMQSLDGTVNISDSSDSNAEEQNVTYKSLPNEENHIVTYKDDAPSKNKTLEKKYTDNGSPVYSVVYSRGIRTAGGMGWNDEMRRFYNQSWNGEYFVLKRVLQKMNPDKNIWKIYTEDRFNNKSNRRHNNMKCTNCCEFGHMRSKCKRPKKPMICYMCGDSGHLEPRCPNTICLRCGNKTQVFTKSCNSCSFQNRLICPICKIRGHTLDFCPDKWRRYHSTTEPNAYPNTSIEYNPKKYCCICGGRGHLSDNCRSAVRFMEYPVILSTVKSHQKSYGDLPVKSQHGGIGYNLMYEPFQDYNFDFLNRTTKEKYYGRFLNAVGLEFMLKRKRRLNAVTPTETTAKKTKQYTTKYIANPYSKMGSANQKETGNEEEENAPNQVQEITESGNIDEPEIENQEESISVDDNSVDNDVELVGSTIEDNYDIQLNIVNESPARKRLLGNFKSPTTVTSSKSNTEPPLILDSDSNYSFSEHFDLPSTSSAAAAMEEDLNDTPQNISTDLPSTSAAAAVIEANLNESQNNSSTKESNIPSVNEEEDYISLTKDSNISGNARPKPREMEALPDFIPLIDNTEDLDNDDSDEDNEAPTTGISKIFVAAESDDDDDEEDGNMGNVMHRNVKQRKRGISSLGELPCEAKIYLTHFHTKYLLSPEGNKFLVATSKDCKLKARLDFTSIGHVLVIFGQPNDQNKFQRELLLKYRELIDQSNQKQVQTSHNIPKKADVLIRFLRDNITQLLNNLGNVDHLLKRLRHLERQQSKSCFKLAEKARRSLNMILIGQAGLQDGNTHLDKLLISLKTLINDYKSEDVTPQKLRTEITDHWKMIFTAYRHDNYQQLVQTYNRLISKNRMPKLNIDPILLGVKVLDTTLTTEQKQKLEQPNKEQSKQIVPNPLSGAKNTKNLKRKANERATNSPPPPAPSSKIKPSTTRADSPSNVPPAPPAPTMRLDVSNTSTPNKSKTSSTTTSQIATGSGSGKKQLRANSPSIKSTPRSEPTNTVTSNKSNKISSVNNTTGKKQQSRPNSPNNTSTPNKSSKSSSIISQTSGVNSTGKKPSSTPNKSKSSSITSQPTTPTSSKKHQQKILPPPPFADPEKRSTVSTEIQKVSDKWQSTCDTLLTEISAEPSKKTDGNGGGGGKPDCKLPSTFWSRESLRYLDECMRLAATKRCIVEKLERVQNKSKNGQLSYNDYLAVIKLHTALSGK